MVAKLFSFFILFLPFQLALSPASGVDLASARVVAILIFLLWLAQSFKRRRLRIPDCFPLALFLSFLFLAGFSIFFAGEPNWAWRKYLFLLSFFPLYFVTFALASDREGALGTVRILVLGGTLAALTGIVQFFLPFIVGLDPTLRFWEKIMPFFLGEHFARAVLEYPSWVVNVGGINFFRAIGFFPDPHMFSLFLGLILPWSAFLAFERMRHPAPRHFLWLLPFFLILLADLLSFSRGGFLGLLAGLATAFFFLDRKLALRIAGAGAVIFFLFLIIPNPVGERFLASFDPEEGSNRERVRNWKEGWLIVRENPWTGTGIGNYSLAVKPLAGYREPIYAHNLYLDLAAETGLLAFFSFFLLLLLAIRNFSLSARSDLLWTGGVLSLIIFSVHSFFESGLYSVQVLPVLIIILALGARPQHDQT